MMPTIQTTLGALVQAEPALSSLCALKLSAKSAYHLAKLAKLVTVETAHWHQVRNAAVVELGTPNPDGTTVNFTPETGATFNQRLEDLNAVPVTISWGPITLDMLGDERVSAANLAALGPLVADPPEPEGP